MINEWIYVVNRVRPFGGAGRPSCVAKTLTLDITRKVFNHVFFHTCHAYKYYCRLSFNTTFADLDIGWGHKVSAKQNLMASFARTLFK